MNYASILLLAVCLDFVWGDPGGRFHPVALIGKLINIVESLFYKENISSKLLFFRGMFAALFLLITIGFLIYEIQLNTLNFLGTILQGILLSFAISVRTLAKRGVEIASDVEKNNLIAARHKLSLIVSRDTAKLNQDDVIRGTIETMAENIVDGLISPLFWFLIFGLPGAFIYRTANTLDAMWGYRNIRYEYFGKFAARVDDVLNFIPARICGIILLSVALLSNYKIKSALQNWKNDASKHPSPNAGIPEAIVAGLLGIRLGGYNYYGDIEHFRAFLGTKIKPFTSNNIYELRKLLYLTSFFYTFILYIVLRMKFLPLA